MGIRCQSEILQDFCGTASGRSGPRLERAPAIDSVCNHELKSQRPGRRLFYYKSTMSRIIAKATGDDGLICPASPAKSCDLSRFRVPCRSGCSFHVLRDQQHHTCGERISSCNCPLIALDLTWLSFLHSHLAGRVCICCPGRSNHTCTIGVDLHPCQVSPWICFRFTLTYFQHRPDVKSISGKDMA
jgi:hypothetical protein